MGLFSDGVMRPLPEQVSISKVESPSMMSKWDAYYLRICQSIATNSKCNSRKIGAILVRDKSIISTGYNGPPRGVTHCGNERVKKDPFLRDKLTRIIDPTYMDLSHKCPRKLLDYSSGKGLEYCPAAHAEQNCVANAARMGVATNGSILYMNTQIPCKVCMGVLINAGVIEIVVTMLEFYDDIAEYIAKDAQILVRDFYGKIKCGVPTY